MPVQYIERKTGRVNPEKVAGDRIIRWLYETGPGHFCLTTVIKRKLISFLYGKLQDISFSRRKIGSFVEDFQIDMKEAKIEDSLSYLTFNDFFIRELKPECRPLASDPNILTSPTDGKILVWENIDAAKMLQVKGREYALSQLLENQGLAEEYSGGTCMVIRLCPADYHRFHFPDWGTPSPALRIRGNYYSVNPTALKAIPELYCRNKRELTLFHSRHFGKILMLEVGATCVGSIVQTFSPGQDVKKGDQKGYFKFGGSTVIMLIKKNVLKTDQDLLANTSSGFETKIYMGERIGMISSLDGTAD